ncbi:MAG: RNA polymerase sigma factor [Actinomycetia bacterium]|nr:RNA polymerase sigma factor [Actinomycetes bacterium]
MDLGGLDDAGVVARASTKPEIFAELFDRHATALHRYAIRRVGADDAEDVLMATFTAAFEARDRFVAPEHGSARPWLFGIASNVVKRHYRTTRRYSDLAARLKAERSELSMPTETVDEFVSLAAALERLPDVDRETLLLVSLGEFSYEEAAAALDVPIGTVRSRVSRARGRLREPVDSAHEGDSS